MPARKVAPRQLAQKYASVESFVAAYRARFEHDPTENELVSIINWVMFGRLPKRTRTPDWPYKQRRRLLADVEALRREVGSQNAACEALSTSEAWSDYSADELRWQLRRSRAHHELIPSKDLVRRAPFLL